ncbi:MAG: hypothetical protein ONB46_02780 [candidate division KSB1 bacterium]|nr:hypothetical protein [candidate division KSB1 bacterium]MDZ7364839.1 hypothetical protein [candidate division KSB1 bacterium]MDZ7402942.1 hypothetical protein [candidate division KSB1 bacterium]
MPETKNRSIRVVIVIAGFIVAMIAGAALSEQLAKIIPSTVKTQQQARHEKFDWGTFYTYVVWKWNNKGLALPAKPSQEHK